ncbi:MAG: tRNA (adenosine(37)-N6)-dimethylallyltransferase MiaA [Candidatus Omnitrophica bacterium]|nr:tRNA (adenosine(37)-N6)-dimethylallyltransferase MiaA [Candidatus Omnitrophota bacterium]MBD3269671.1 tRNA (adenosine(37)-N6)-dimethylallyltransferase MiaA [Candidatus Omnitrophota bacterium]
MRTDIIFIVGPTATGKSDAAFRLAKSAGAQIISCDSMLIYQEPRIITSKPSKQMLDEVKHHFINIISVEENYSVFDYYKQCISLIDELIKKDTPLIACGGTGLYVKALLDGIFEGAGRDDALRERLRRDAEKHGNLYLYEKLKKIDPQTAAKFSANDLKRIIRALEVYSLSGKPISAFQKEARGIYGKYNIKIFGFKVDRERLYERINKRVGEMFSEGAVREVGGLMTKNLSLTAEKIIGIKEISGFLRGELSEQEAGELMKKNTRNFAKRQFTWFNKDKRIEWIDADDLSPGRLSEKILKEIEG